MFNLISYKYNLPELIRPLVSLFLTTPTIILILLSTPLSISKSGKTRLQLFIKVRIVPPSLEDNLANQNPFSSTHEHKILDWSISTCTGAYGRETAVGYITLIVNKTIRFADKSRFNPNFIRTYLRLGYIRKVNMLVLKIRCKCAFCVNSDIPAGSFPDGCQGSLLYSTEPR